jgi:hypothetical protein
MTVAINRVRDIANVAAAGAGSVAIARNVTSLSPLNRGAGLVAGLSGAMSLATGDRAQISKAGSAMQTLGGVTLFVAKTPKTAMAGSVLAVGGAVTNAIERYLPAEKNSVLNPVLKGAVMGTSAGLAIGSMRDGLAGLGFHAFMGGILGTGIGGMLAIK